MRRWPSTNRTNTHNIFQFQYPISIPISTPHNSSTSFAFEPFHHAIFFTHIMSICLSLCFPISQHEANNNIKLLPQKIMTIYAGKHAKNILKTIWLHTIFRNHFEKKMCFFLSCCEAKLGFLMLPCDDFRSTTKTKNEKSEIPEKKTKVKFWAPQEPFF